LTENKRFAEIGMKRRVGGSVAMKTTVLAAAFALAGAGLILPSAADAAVFAPAQSAMRDQAGSVMVQVQGQRQQRAVRSNVRPTFRAVPNRTVRQQQFGGQGRRTISRPARITNPGRAVGPARSFNPGRAAVVHRRGFRPAGYRRWHPQHLVVRRWNHRPYYGRIVGGIALGTILAASAYYVYAAEPPAPGLCWFWADPDETQGYWDYCVDPS
jgi:hypothetical protein